MNFTIRRLGSLRRLALATAAALVALAGCGKIAPINGPARISGGADFSRYVALGTSLSAGAQSGGGIEDLHQARSFPADFARQIGTPFTQPLVSPAGFPQLFVLQSLQPLSICTSCRTDGAFYRLDQPTAYDNLGIPGALLVDVADSSLYYNAAIRGQTQVELFANILRHRGTMLSEAASLDPTFVSFELGANEVLGAATQGSGNALVSPANFAALLHGTLDALAAATPHAKLAIFNVPDVTTIPFTITIPPYVVNPATGQPVLVGGQKVYLIGPGGTALTASDDVLLPAASLLQAGTGIPVALGGNGQPLPDQVVLSAAEVASLRTATDAYNASIAAEAQARGAALVDLHGVLQQIAAHGYDYRGSHYTNAFITGGLFSLDGVHANDFGYGIMANAMIDAVNARFGSNLRPVDLASVASVTASTLTRSPWGPAAGSVLPRIADRREAFRHIVPIPEHLPRP